MHARDRLYRRRALHRRQGDAEEGPRHPGRRPSRTGWRWRYDTIDKMAAGDFMATSDWNGAAFRARLEEPGDPLRLSQGRLSRSGWTTSPCSRTPRTSRTPSCSRTSSWTRKRGDDLGLRPLRQRHRRLRQIHAGRHEGRARGRSFRQMRRRAEIRAACPPEVQEIYTKIWTELQK